MKKKFYILGIVCLFLLIITGMSYAVWQITLQQTTENVVTTGCFKIEFRDVNPINLEKAYPITDNEGEALTPYEFTITNTCNSYASYQINLEILDTTTLENLNYLKVMLENKENILTENEVVTKTLENAKTSYKLQTGYLRENKSKTFSLRLWMDENTPTREEFMNKLFESKVTVIATYKDNLDNNIEVSAVSQNESFSESETFQIHAASENYDLVSISEDLETWEELETKGKDITVEKTVTENGTYTYYFQDEAENIQEVTVTATKIDDKKPIANMSVTKSNNVISINASGSLDNETSISKYYYSKDGTNYIESTNSTYEFPIFDYGVATTMLENYKNQKVYVKVEDEIGNVSDVKEYALTTNELMYDGTSDNNLRYVGASPNNWVWFGENYESDIYDFYYAGTKQYAGFTFSSKTECESFRNTYEFVDTFDCVKIKNKGDKILWQVIGVMNHIKTSTSDTIGASRVKLIKEDSIGPYSWYLADSIPNDGWQAHSAPNNSYGINEWSKANLKTILNDYYYNSKTNQICISGVWNPTFMNSRLIPCDFGKYGLEENLKPLIEDALWHTGSNGSTSWDSIVTSKFYQLERSSNTGKICSSGVNCNDTVTRTTKWVGKIGLMYPSDYGYATSGGSSTSRSTCLATNLYNWDSYSNCYLNDWLYNANAWQWTITPRADSQNQNATQVFHVYPEGKIWSNTAANSIQVEGGAFARPTLYLKREVKIVSGMGSKTAPFQLSLN